MFQQFTGLRGTPEERARMHSGVDTRVENTRFDLSDEGHNRMIMPGGYAGVSLNEDGTYRRTFKHDHA